MNVKALDTFIQYYSIQLKFHCILVYVTQLTAPANYIIVYMSGTGSTLFATLLTILAVHTQHLVANPCGKLEPRAMSLNDTSSFSNNIEEYYQLLHLPGLVVGVALGDSLIFFKSMGTANPSTNKPLTEDHIFPIASLTKSFTGVALKQMEGEGKLSLNDQVTKYPNRYFTPGRWNQQTTLGQIVSHTSESSPPGSQFVYNGSKYNIAFNAFCAINKTNDSNDITRPFTEEIQRRILTPLKMKHTLLRFTEKEHGYLKKWFAQTYRLNDADGMFTPVDFNPNNMQSGPGFGMMSSVNDLVRYSSALGQNKLLTALQYKQLTTPFYPGSPYGIGWFTTSFEGTELHWAYGYGNNDAALLLRVPSKNLTLIVLSPCSLPSASTRLGYGNPFNSMVVCSFFRCYVQKGQVESRLPIEEQFAKATTLSFLPVSLHPDTSVVEDLLQELIKEYASDAIWQTPTAFELVSRSSNPAILRFGLKMADRYVKSKKLHPIKAWYAGLIYEKNGETEKAESCFEWLAEGDQYCEQGCKFDAMMKVARRNKSSNLRHCKKILQNLVRFKGYVNTRDQQYKDAEEMLKQLETE